MRLSVWCAVLSSQFAWGEVLEHLKEMQAAADSFDNRCKRLPKKLKEWEAYLVLRKTITDLQVIRKATPHGH